MRRMNLGLRVGLAAGLSTFAVMAIYAWGLHHALRCPFGPYAGSFLPPRGPTPESEVRA